MTQYRTIPIFEFVLLDIKNSNTEDPRFPPTFRSLICPPQSSEFTGKIAKSPHVARNLNNLIEWKNEKKLDPRGKFLYRNDQFNSPRTLLPRDQHTSSRAICTPVPFSIRFVSYPSTLDLAN